MDTDGPNFRLCVGMGPLIAGVSLGRVWREEVGAVERVVWLAELWVGGPEGSV
jgi:hypothetical protein